MNSFQTRTGRTIYVRPIQPADTEFLIDIFDHMSSNSRYRRFNTPADHISEARVKEEAERIATADPNIQHGLMALVRNDDDSYTAVGAGRYMRLEDPTTAEFAMSVRDDYQQQGIGQTLLQLLVAQAQASNVHYFVSYVQNSNDAAFALLRHVHVPYTRHVEDDATVVKLQLLDE